MCLVFFFFKQKTAYEMRISDWSSDVCSSDLRAQSHEDRRRHLHLHQREHHHREPAEQQRSAPWLSQRKSSATRTRDRKSVVSGKSVSVRVDLGGRRIIKKKKKKINKNKIHRKHTTHTNNKIKNI